MKSLVTICIVNFNSSDFIEISLYALSRLTKNSYKVFILDNGSMLDDYENLKKVCAKYSNVFIKRWEKKFSSASLAHGTALNYLCKKIDTPYFSILDADAIWLKKDWDEILLRKLKEDIKVIGTQASGEKPKDFPLMFAILFETTTFKKIGIDFRPNDLKKLEDTGHEIRIKYLEKNIMGAILKVKNTRNFKKGMFGKLVGVEEYYLDNSLIVSHFGRGATLGNYKYTHGEGVSFIYKLPIISRPLRHLRGSCEKNKWIKICRKIIDDESKK